jgi:DNA helicase-2/ATP-dependent DNA helicase PcrA
MNLYKSITNKNCVKAYLDFLKSKKLKLTLVGDKVKNEDAYGILFFKMFVFGLDKYDDIKHVVIDEMQDYSPLQLHILDYLYDCPKTILGDYNQSILSGNIRNNMKFYDKILSGEVQLLNLNKSYRSTVEIVDFYNVVGHKDTSEVFARNGEQVDIVNCAKGKDIDEIVKIVNSYKEHNFNSIAIITKTNKESQTLYEKIKDKIKDINLIDDNTDEYDNKTCVISAMNSKGLEFDGVIVYDVSDNYNSDIDRDILYIASTRAMHKLTILSIDTESSFIKEFKERI